MLRMSSLPLAMAYGKFCSTYIATPLVEDIIEPLKKLRNQDIRATRVDYAQSSNYSFLFSSDTTRPLVGWSPLFLLWAIIP